ncbi:phosphodiester glycosidase family protein [Pedobacter montanisoli]|uniref:Phosphodiester glycosidase family protein n=1 Tax=Pedobacter montanisoli TaxID=2923277 RepID=A0ABS9ZT29_9SPHI|nr:phosphodiester glycosidase family protein [Pedobacter montanisoli]MCJ0741750.1 phosphodiester glycosidase family protein [Pedobacter montanisoli]
MFKQFICVTAFLALFSSSFAQQADSVVFVNAHWSKKKVSKRTHLLTHHFNEKNLFAANQNISYLEVKNRGEKPFIAFGFDPRVLKETRTFADENNAFAAINGTFFDIKNGGSVDYLRVNGQTVNENQLGKGGNRALHQRAAIVIDHNKLQIKKWDGSTDWEKNLGESNVMLSGPLLIINNQKETLDTVAFNKLRHPRTAIGIKPNGNLLFLTVDGRNENSDGMSLFELSKIMSWLGCTSAINLDGGGSTTLWVRGQNENGVVNYPSDNKKWDHNGQRKVANVILLKTSPKQ